MLSLSQTTGYAILALGCLESCTESYLQAKDIAACTKIPLPYLSQLLHSLAAHGLVASKRGYQGGFHLTQPAEQISLSDIAEAVEGKDWCPKCLLGLEECSHRRCCPTHDFWQEERERIRGELARITLKDVADYERRRGGRLPKRCRPG